MSERLKLRKKVQGYVLDKLEDGLTLGKMRDEVAKLIAAHGEAAVVQAEPGSNATCRNCDDDDLEVTVHNHVYLEREETDEEFAARATWEKGYALREEARLRAEYERLRAKFEPATAVTPPTAAIVGGLSEEQHEALCDALDAKPEVKS